MISEVSSSYVHHIVIYLCAELNDTFVGATGVCVDTHLAIQSCRGSEVIAAWAVGGTVSKRLSILLHVDTVSNINSQQLTSTPA